MLKKDYQAPLIELYELKLEGALLNNSVGAVQAMTGKAGSWDDDDEFDY